MLPVAITIRTADEDRLERVTSADSLALGKVVIVVTALTRTNLKERFLLMYITYSSVESHVVVLHLVYLYFFSTVSPGVFPWGRVCLSALSPWNFPFQ